jgi:regulator of sirC expression with transglutaminase-like and TPR domain
MFSFTLQHFPSRFRQFIVIALTCSLAACSELTKPIPVIPTLISEPTIITPTLTRLPDPTQTDQPNPTEQPTAVLPTHEPTPSVDIFLTEADKAAESGDWENAIENYTQAISLSPSNTAAFHRRGIAYEEVGNLEQAINDFNQAVAIDPNYAPAYNSRGVTYFNLGSLEFALEDFGKAIEVDPTYATSYKNRALVQKERGLPQVVLIDLQVYLALDPDAVDREAIEELIGEMSEQIEELQIHTSNLPFFDDFEDTGIRFTFR